MARAGLKAIPTISLVMDSANFDIYTNALERGPAWERPVSVELINPDPGQAGFQIDAGIRMQGNIGRQPYMPKHSFRLFFRREYGQPALDFPLFLQDLAHLLVAAQHRVFEIASGVEGFDSSPGFQG